MSGWETVESTGLLDDCDITITKAEFGFDAQYANGEQPIMIFTGTSTHEGYPEFTQFFSIGKGWEVEDGGARVSGAAKGFNSRSQYGIFLTRAVELAGAALTGRGMPDNASVWVGLKFHVNRQEVDYGEEIGKKQVLVPTAFLGVEGKAEAPAPQTTVEAPSGAASSNGSNKVLAAKLMVLAKQASDHDAFIEAVLESHPEITDDADLFESVLDSGTDGFYAKSH